MNSFEYADATGVADAISLMNEGAAIKAGGVDLLDLMKEHISAPSRLVNIRNIRELDYIKLDGDTLRIGPLTTLAALADNETAKKQFTALADAAQHAATPQIRNMATIGGNLLQRPRCWYFRNELFHCRKKGGEICYAQEGENQYHAIFNNGLCAIVHPSATATALVALDASIELTGARAKRVMKLEDFFVLPSVDLHHENSIKPDEILTEIRVPVPRARAKSVYFKQGEKESFDWPLAEVAAAIESDGGGQVTKASIILGASAPVPHRAKDAEAALVGKKIDESLARSAASVAMKDATPLANNRYKIALFKSLIEQAITKAGAMA